jgi:hypothetical protein
VRLVALLLSAALAPGASAQTARALPWEGLPAPFWQGLFEDLPEPVPPPPNAPQARPAAAGGLRVRLAADGALVVADAGRARLRADCRAARSRSGGGRGASAAPWSRSVPDGDRHPLFSAAFWSQEDPRRGLSGLLWVLDDSERILSLLHPATGKVAFLPLPEAVGVDLHFLPSGLAVSERPVEGAPPTGRVRRWILPWVALVPVLARLAPAAEPPKAGTALQPFPKE